MNSYKLRLECFSDLAKLLESELCTYTPRNGNAIFVNTGFTKQKGEMDVEMTFDCKSDLDFVVFILTNTIGLRALHVAVETVNYEKDYTGERVRNVDDYRH